MLIPTLIAISMIGQTSRAQDRMAWWREARFGMFIHWGLYSILAGEWNGSKGHAEWIRETAHIPVAEYERLLNRFNPVKFDADAWVKMAKDAGMKYIVITSKHHDGFNLWDSPYTEWDVMSTPFHRDILKELSEACKRQGIVFCTYHSIMDWHHPDYLPKRSWEGESWRQSTVDHLDLSNYNPDYSKFVEYLRNEVRTIIQRYHPGVMWFDGEWENTWTHAFGKPLYELCLKTDPNIIVNNRVDVFREGMEGMTSNDKAAGDFGTPEQTIPATGMPGVDWETCMTMNNNWGYNAEDHNFKSTKEIVRMLIDIASKGGNYLLNIGPRPDGTFPDESVQRLKEIGQWMKINGESIYGTSASPFKSLAWGRCTQKRTGGQTTLYLHVFEPPKDGRLIVPGLANKPVSARALSSRRDTKVWREGPDLVVQMADGTGGDICTTYALRIEGAPIVFDAPEIITESSRFVNPVHVKLKANPQIEIRYTTDGSDPDVHSKRFDGDLVIRETCTLKARSFHNGKPVSGVSQIAFEKVKPRPAKDVVPQNRDLN